MKYKAYPKYKDSGVAWLGEVPEHWGIKRGRFCMKINPRSDRMKALALEDEISFIPMEAIAEHGGLNLENTRQVGEVGSGYTEFQDGDVVVAKITPCFENYKGAIAEGLVNGAAFGTTELHVLRVSQQIERRFLFYLTMSSAYRRNGEAEMYGAGGQKRVPPDFNKDFPVPLPPNPEQLLIADFLNSETKKIDTLLAKKRALVEKLKEKRTAVISRTVTRGLPPEVARAAGLDPHPKLKPSGVEWLGDVPEHWGVKRLKFILKAKKGAIKTGPFGSQLQSSDMINGEIKVYNQRTVLDQDVLGGENYISSEKYQELNAFEVFPGDILVTTRGTIGRCMIVPIDSEKGILHPCLMRIQAKQKTVCNRYLELLIDQSGLVLEQLKIMSNATIIEVIYSQSLKEVWLPIPPIPEQESIIEYIDSETSKIDQLASKIESAIERLQEYRTALITAAVTGKIDVREKQA